MKQLTIAFFAAVLTFSCGITFAAEQNQNNAANPAKRSIFQIGFFPGVPGATKDYNVYGFKIGAPMVDGFNWVYGMEASVLYSGTFHIKGCQATLAGPTIAIRVEGVQAATGPAFLKELIGFQASPSPVILEYGYGCQAGVASIANRFKGFQTGAVTVAYNQLDGFQFGVVNVVDEVFRGCQVGGVNVVTGSFKGCQVGVVNIATQGGFQVGGINIMPDALIPVLPFFNYAPAPAKTAK